MTTPQPGFAPRALAVAIATIISVSAYAQEQGQDPLQLSNVVVTASGFEQNIKDAPATISVIDAEELRSKAYTNITDALRHVAGVNVEGSGVNQSISIRGMAPEFTLFLIDGRPLSGTEAFDMERGNHVGGNSVNLLPPLEMIERIEVIRGPASALYGSDAMGGVINIITRRVTNEFVGSISTEYTKSDNDISEDAFQTNFFVNAPLARDRLSLQVHGGFQNLDESTYQGTDSTPEYKQRNIGTKLSWVLDERNNVTLGNTYVQADRKRTSGVSIPEDEEPDTSDMSMDNTRSVRSTYFLTHDGKYDRLYTNSYINYDLTENRTSGIDAETITLNTQGTVFLGSHTVTAGLNYKDESLSNGSINAIPDIGKVELERYHWAAFVEDQWALADHLLVTLSGRYDKNEHFGDHFSPKVYGVYHLTDSLTLKGGVTSGFKVAKLAEASPDYGFGSMGGIRLGNPNLKPEESLNKEIGVLFDKPEFGLNTSLTVYETDYENKLARSGSLCPANTECVIHGITYPPSSSGYTTTINLEEVETKGAEHTLDYRITPTLSYRHNYTYTKTEYVKGPAEGVPLRDSPKHMFNASLYWDTTDQLTLWTQANYRGRTSGNQGSVRGNATGEFDPETVHSAFWHYDAGLSFRASKDLRLNAGLYNISNKLITTEDGYSNTIDGRRLVVGMNYQF